MSYKEGIINAITELKDRKGSSMIAIKKYMQEHLPKDKKWLNATFLTALKHGVAAGDLIKVKNSFKLSPEFKKAAVKKATAAAKPKAAPKKKATAKKSAPKKKAATAKKTATKAVTKKTAPKKSAPKKAAPKKATVTKKAATAKATTKKTKTAPKKAAATKAKAAPKKKSATKKVSPKKVSIHNGYVVTAFDSPLSLLTSFLSLFPYEVEWQEGQGSCSYRREINTRFVLARLYF
jgi:histone H1/5